MTRFHLWRGFAALIVFFWAGCAPSPDAPPDAAAAIPADASPADVARALLDNKRSATSSDALTTGLPALDRPKAYAIQLAGLVQHEAAGETVVGWKLGGARVTAAAPSPDPSFAYLLRADHFEPGATLTPARFVDGDLQVEAEIGFVLGADVLGPEVDMATVRAAVKEVVGAIELIDVRVKLPADAAAPGMNYMIADALSNGGVILGETRVSADALDLAKEMARAEVNGEIVSSGAGKQIFGTSPWDALLWLANELPKHGRMLRAGEVVITGSLIDNPTIRAGDRAEVVFEHLGRIEVSLAGQE